MGESFSWTHSAASDYGFLIMQCPCGIAHTVDRIQDGGMSVVDCCCGRAYEIQHPAD